ncbi:CopG family transcriptional regulator [Rhizobium sp. ICMP 5592]|uniref:CopG family transcriptional regulator n=1 Tax=Rhizobium sp. ICMP 5592 TaxID=2292445 RepID=UPI0012970A55|nr:CopG family transcriptional regulator [Rhizobium sp. ICMP 5592]MQB45476.1 CopG family transcriptional regulator [Rhizobium sp. ICMP 5592]
MTTRDFAVLLEETAARIADVSRPDLQILLRRAAIMVRNSGSIALNEDVEEALCSVAGQLNMTRNQMIRYIVQEWLETNTYLPVRMLDEDSEADGSA